MESWSYWLVLILKSDVVPESKLAFKLELPPQMKIHPVFHESLLRPYWTNTILGHTQPPPPRVEIDGHEEYILKEILDSRIRRTKLEYYIDWEGYLPSERTWEPAENVENAKEAVNDFHTNCPNRASPADITRRRNEPRKLAYTVNSQELSSKRGLLSQMQYGAIWDLRCIRPKSTLA